ncbi:family 78 glycoside hydrolase catalytic domain [Spirosoma validum]|uniref:alpha-L-rhamnosidase n=1 Tax=Spirosoma validum TaxID=2771355 RepID=A0A927B9H1_9BACT|nr:family 78 glycoside hydrolase catalytic domain [Spirosoma validum]MBD2757636.1 family 78 glycoside hydrolase catalytic domain [Spirosoma validum]
MKILWFSFLALLVTFLAYGGNQNTDLKISNLRTEYLVNPVGLDVTQPRLSWELVSAKRGQSQSAYQILVSIDSLSLVNGAATIWDSGKVESDRASQVRYTGSKLVSRTTYFWKVRVWDAGKNVSSWSAIASWSMGLLNKEDWHAHWIGAPEENVPDSAKFTIWHSFQSGSSAAENAGNQWVDVDLGLQQEIRQIKLYPVDYKLHANGYLFPKRFKILVSATADFKKPTVIADESAQDYDQKGLEPYSKLITPVTGRYIRVVVSKLKKTAEGKYAYAFAELEAINGSSENVALKKPVVASVLYATYPAFSGEKWTPAKLTDGAYAGSSANRKPFKSSIPASPLLRKTFTVTKKVKQATLYASALGMYEMTINGKKAGNQVLAPEWTDYHERVQYQTYDVTKSLKKGVNVMGAMLADGWYAGGLFSHPDRGAYGFDRRLIGQLELLFDDGTRTQIVTDASWNLLENGPVQTASIFDGEHFNAKLLPAKWMEPDFDDAAWKPATVDKTISKTLNAQGNEPIRVIQEITPVKVVRVKDDTYIVDLGQNIAGWVNLKIPYNPKQPITFRHGEVLDEKGQLYVSNLRAAKQIDVYTPGLEASIDYEPRFTYHGFRYVEISGLTQEPKLTNVTGKVVASAAPLAGTFESSSPDLNKLWANILWTQRGNMHSAPTDCPQRDERAGWMGDAQVFAQTSIFNLDMSAFFTKWVRDIADCQRADGRYPDYTPQVDKWNRYCNAPGWSDAGVLVPWRMYENYGDTAILARQYTSMKAYIQHILNTNPDLLWKNERGNMYGDWLNGNTIIADDYPKEGGKVDNDIYSTAFFGHSTRTVAKVARLLGHQQDYTFYDSLANAIKARFVSQYVAGDGTIAGNTQAAYALALDFDLVPEKLQKQAAAHMVQAIKAYDYRISTGIQSTIRLMNQLSEYGYADVAYKLLESRRFPSWIYSIDQGATTIWERWDGYVKGRGFQNVGMNSFNHYAIGAVGEWMYRSILGINADSAGYKHFTIKPRLGGSLTWAKGSYQSIAGKIAVDWKVDKGTFQLSVQIPPNTTATVFLPSGKSISENGQRIAGSKDIRILETTDAGTALRVPSGSYAFSVAL